MPPGTLDAFEAELRASHGQLIRTDDLGLADEILRIAANEGARSFAAWDAACHGDLAERLTTAGLSRVFPKPPPDDPRPSLGAVDLGLVHSDLAVAENGSVVLTFGPGRSRLIAILPPVLVIVLRGLTLLSSLEELAAVLAARTSSNTSVLVNGPSCTGDVKTDDFRPIDGMHGPHRVFVVAVASASG
jgi:L-lactate utilization protein LutC